MTSVCRSIINSTPPVISAMQSGTPLYNNNNNNDNNDNNTPHQGNLVLLKHPELA